MVTISSWLNFGHPTTLGRESAVGQTILAPPYDSQCAVFASLCVHFTLRAKLSGAVYCYRSCILCVGLWVCGSVTMITWYCVHRSSQTRFVGEGSDHLQLVKFWPSHTPGKGSAAGQTFFGFNLLQPAHSVCISLSAFFKTERCKCYSNNNNNEKSFFSLLLLL